MRKQGIVISILGCLMQLMSVNGQDLHYSQHVNNPLYYNPALTGFIQQKARVIASYADRYRQSFGSGAMRTAFLSGDMNFSMGGPYQRSFIGLGAYFYNHKRGLNAVSDNVAAISGTYRILLDENNKHSLSAGFNVSLWNRSFNYNNLQFGNQYDGMMYNPAVNSGESNSFPNQTNMNAAAGVVYAYDTRNVVKGYVGFSFLNLFPDQSRTDRTYLPMRYNMHAGLNVDWGKTSLIPTLMIDYQRDAMEIYTGAIVNHTLVDTKITRVDFFAGPYVRAYKNPSAGFSLYTLNLLTGVSVDDWQFMFSIDNTLNSSKSTFGGFNGFELMLTYAFGEALSKSKPIYCPNFR